MDKTNSLTQLSGRPLEEDVIKELKWLGYSIKTQIEVHTYLVAITIVSPDNPDQYVAGIECESTNYDNSRTVRERDKTRFQALESFGWKLYHIWSASWFKRRSEVLKDLNRFLQQLSKPTQNKRGNIQGNKIASFIQSSLKYEGTRLSQNARVNKYHGDQLDSMGIKVLLQLEKMCKRRIPKVTNLNLTKFGYTSIGTSLISLGLYNQGLPSLPENISSLHNLHSLHLSKNRLCSLPESITRLHNLKELNLSENCFISFPKGIVSLYNLNTIDFWNNQLSSVPIGIGSLTNLVTLELGNNQLLSIPEDITLLFNLRKLGLEGNELSSLPENIGLLRNLLRLNLDRNQITSLPESIGSLKNLLRLDLDHNQLSILPESLTVLTKLRELYLYNNKLSSLPKNMVSLKGLQKLGLSGSHLVSLSKSVKSALRVLKKNGCEVSHMN